MVVDDKIVESEYFLDKLEKATDRENFIPNLSAFLSATRSIPDFLLEDYNVKYGLNISLNDKLYPRIFEDEAKKKNNHNALKFINRYNRDFKALNNDKVAILLMSKRNIKVHRADVPLKAKFGAWIKENLGLHDSVSVVVTDKYGNIKNRSNSNDESITIDEKDNKHKLNNKPSTESKMSVTFYFHDYKQKDVVEVCKDFLKLIKEFVQKLRADFL